MTQISSVGTQPTTQFSSTPEVEKTLTQLRSYFEDVRGVGPGLGTSSTPPGASTPQLPKPNLSGADIAALLLKLQSEVLERQASCSKDEILDLGEAKAKENKKNLQKIEEYAKKLEAAEKKQKKSKIFGWIGKAIAAIASVAMIVAGVALTAAGGAGAALVVAGAILLASTLLTTTMEVLSEHGIGLGDGIAALLEKFGVKSETAKLIGAIFQTVVIVAVAVAAAVASGGAAGAAQAANVLKAANIIRAVSGISQGVAEIGAGVTNILASVDRHDAEKTRADSMDIQKVLAKLQAMIEQEVDRLQEIIKNLDAGVSKVLQMMRGESDTQRQILQNMA